MARKFRRHHHVETTYIRRRKRHNALKNRSQTRSLERDQSVYRAKQFIRNLSDYKLSDMETIALSKGLSKGLSFITTPNKPKKRVLVEAADGLTRNMRIRYYAALKGWKSRHKFRNPSTWKPGLMESTALEDFLEGMKTELVKVPIKNVQQNMNNEERQAIKHLRNNPDIVLKKFDKGRGVCIMSKKDYISEGHRQLHDKKSYRKLDYDMTQSTTEMVSEVVNDMFEDNEIDKATADYLDPLDSSQTKTPVFFMLPKVHKTPVHGAFIGRPVTSHCGSPLNRISEFLDHYLLPDVQKSPTYLKDTADTIRKIEGLKLPENTILASIDIVSMFTSVPQEEAYEVAMETLAKLGKWSFNPPMPSLKYMGKLLKLVLYRNAFDFNGEHYLQISGTPMGLRSSVSLSCLVAMQLVHQILILDEHIILFHVYMDDSLLIWSGSMAQLEIICFQDQ